MSVHTLQQLVKSISNNRWMTEFTQGEKIGKGGFASVYKAKNHSDKNDYAVKKIKLNVNGLKGNIQEELERVLVEATTLGKFNHDNIIRYYNSWLEVATKRKELAKPQNNQHSKNKGGWREITDEDESDSDDISTYDSFGDLDSSAVVFDRSGEEESEDNHFIFEANVDCSQSTAEQFSQDPSILNHGIQFSDQRESVKMVNPILEALSQGLPKDETIDKIEFFIQTELCNETLGDYIAARNKKLASLQAKNPEAYKAAWKEYQEEALAFAKQILEGLALVHGEGIIHRDLKPQNIFLLNKVCKIGDFGLIKMNGSEASSKTPSEQQQGESRGAVGTRVFASPEQWEGDDENVDFKADIFSLGITFLLMFYPMGTTMEELQVISESKKGNLPASLEKEMPEIAMLIKKMLAADPCERPSLEIVLSHFELPEEEVCNEISGAIALRKEDSGAWTNKYFDFLFLELRVFRHFRLVGKNLSVFNSEQDTKAESVYLLSEWAVQLENDSNYNEDKANLSVACITLGDPMRLGCTFRMESCRQTAELFDKLCN